MKNVLLHKLGNERILEEGAGRWFKIIASLLLHLKIVGVYTYLNK
jgi:hypothetical protein